MLARNTIRTFALVCVAVTSLFILGMIIWTTILLSQANWCEQAIGATEQTNVRPEFAVSACFDLLKQQLAALAQNGLIYAGVIALCLLALMVIVVAGGHLSFRGPGGVGGEIGSTPDDPHVAETPAEGAQAATDAGTAAGNAVVNKLEGEE